ncbi:MAG TPA: MG2 domain-containing protein [Thermoanaerobaculia bacterium]|nr:MG2 domain-containing protein [Thermoanaerobaculia bacterium]
MPSRTPSVLWAAALLLLALAAAPAGSTASARLARAAPGETPRAKAAPRQEGWNQFKQLVAKGKLQQASRLAAALRDQARAAGDEKGWLRGLVRQTQLLTELQEYEAAARLLQEQPWPRSPLYRTTLDLFYARALLYYYRYAGEAIDRRERVESGGALDLELCTGGQLFAAAAGAYRDAWQQRGELGATPLARLADYVEPNNYPPGVRGTLRDALAYLFVDLLADTRLWSPRESNELYLLDLPALVAGDPARAAAVKLDDPAVHPLEKLGALLADLEAWHAAGGRRAAALEARLERLRRLHAALTRPADWALVRADLERRLAAFRADPWWSAGMAQLAELTRDMDEPDSLRRAHGLLRQGEEAFPDSLGGRRCRALREGIEAPDFGLKAMTSDAPGRRSLEVTHKNLARLFFRAYRLDVRRRIEHREQPVPDDWPRPGGAGGKALGAPSASWTAELPATPDFRQHRTYLTPPLVATGVYLVAASARKDFAGKGNRLDAASLVLGDLVLLVRREGDRGLAVRAMSGSTGEPLAGVEVRFYGEEDRARPAASEATGADGLVHLSHLTRGEYATGLVLALRGGEVAFAWTSIASPGESPGGDSALIYTDRSIYRPGQRVLWKVLAYGSPSPTSPPRPRPARPATVTLHDPNGQEVAQAVVTTNEFGTAAGEFTLPPGRPLGTWRLESTPEGSATIQVEEYKRPTFEAKLLDPAEPLRLNRPARLRGEARYYFGLPVTAGRVAWRVRRRPIYPRWDWLSIDPASEVRGEPGEVVAAGQAALGAGGGFEIAFTPRADERERPEESAGPEEGAARSISYSYLVSAEVTDEGGETREAERAFRLGWVAVEAEVIADGAFFLAGGPARLRIARRDLDGTSRPGEGSWRLLELRQPAGAALPADEEAPPAAAGAFQTPGDRQRPRWAEADTPASALRRWADGRQLATATVRHDVRGQAEVELPVLPPGAYRLRYETRDDFGARCEAVYELVVAGSATRLALPVVLLAESPSVRVGGTARFLVRSGLPDQPLLFELRRGDRLLSRSLRSGRDAEIVELPVGPEDRGGIAARLVLVRDHQLLAAEASVFVPWDDHELALEFNTFRDRIRPGTAETWRVKVRPLDGSAPEAAAAELLAYMYDRSLDLFVPHQPPALLDALPRLDRVESWESTLGGDGETIGGWDWPRVAAEPELHGDDLSARLWPARMRRRRGGVAGAGIGGVGGYGGIGVTAFGPPVIAPPAMAPRPAFAVAETSTVAAPAERRSERRMTAPAEGGIPKPPPPSPPPVQLRSDFAETAFWQPHLLTGADGTATLEFKVPDSVTAWKVWVHAVSRDLRSGSLNREALSVKELMVRPYLPRFLREGDRAELKVAVNNASAAELAGNLRLEILDPESEQSLAAAFGLATDASGAAARRFEVAPGGAADFAFAITAPRRVGPVAFKVTATAGGLGDGELRALPVLPSRLQLVQTRFVALRGGPGRREMTFEDLRRDDDPTRLNQQLVVTLDGQLFYSMLRALPYLVDYPYECTEQTLNRFLSTGIMASLFARYPAVASMAQELAKRETRYETWDSLDPNRKMALEETPWLAAAQGGDREGESDSELIRVLDPRIARAERDAALARLEKAQLPSGAFPWWPGGPPSPYMTLYLMYGFAKASELGVELPRPLVERGWSYLAAHYRAQIVPEMKKAPGCCLELLTFLNYVASSYPDPSWMGQALSAAERRAVLDRSFLHWRELSPYLKTMLALTLRRAGRAADARLVWDSVMDAAKTTPDEGTFWAPEENAWLWYRDTVESHALALRAAAELEPGDRNERNEPRAEGLVQWLFLNRQLNHWKSTRATAEVLYALSAYLGRSGQLAAREAAVVQVGGREASFVFEPDRYTASRSRMLVEGPQLDPRRDATVVVAKQTPGLMFASATWSFSTEELPKQERGDLFAVSRRYFRRLETATDTVLRPLAAGEPLAVGDEIEVQLALHSRAPAEYVHLRDPRAAGLEPAASLSGYRWDLGVGFYQETRDSGANFFIESLPAGEYTLRYRLRANLAGTFRVGPATVQSMYAPEFAAYSAGDVLTVGSGK